MRDTNLPQGNIMEQKAFVSLILASMLAATLHADQSQNDSPTSDEPSTPSLESTSKDAPSTPTMLNPVSAFAKKNAKLDSLNRNTYTLDKSQITDKGYNQSTNIFQYMPFVGLNDTGLGSNIDLRSQGARANTSVQVLINGVPSNMLDSSHGVTPISTLSPNTIESIEILPGGGAVMYGNGTRGGVVSITTQKRYEKPFFSAGASYGNIIASTGNNINADAKFGTKLRSGTRSPIYVSLGAAYIHQGGPRQGDLTQGAQANGSFVIDFGDRASLDFSLDYFGGSIKTSPNNSFQITPNPSKNDRDKAGYGSLHNTQHRVDASLGLVAHLTENSTLDVRSFFHLNRIDYVDSTTNLALYMNAFKDVSADQNGSFFDDKKAGVIVKYDLHHAKGRFITGLESIYNRGERVMNQHIFWQGDPVSMMGQQVSKYDHTMKIPFQGSKWSNAAFMIEKYDFSKRFSLTGGARYEWAYYDIDVTYNSRINMTTQNNGNGAMVIPTNAKGALQDSLHNYALELTPSFAYSDTGAVYLKYEKGFFSPSPNSMLKREGRGYAATNLKKEEYHTLEAGLKDFFGDFLSLSLSAFYTLTQNEFYTIGNAHSLGGVSYNNYDFTQRAGIEAFSQQFFFNDRLSFNESFTYVNATILQDNGSKTNRTIPYTSSYKATLGASLALGRHWSLWTQHSFFGAQKDIVGATIPAYSLSDIGISAKYGDFSLTAGVRNIFDSFYYTYYNSDKTDPIAGYGFLIGAGRSVFVQGRYEF